MMPEPGGDDLTFSFAGGFNRASESEPFTIVPSEYVFMKRLVLAFGCACLLATPALATNEFAKEWKDHYAGEDADQVFVKASRKAGCNVCHVKGEKKTERNEYGAAVKEFLKKEDFEKDWVKANPEKAKELIVAGLKMAGEKMSSDGKTFASKIEAGELPATDSGL
jgi:hypothetical protein